MEPSPLAQEPIDSSPVSNIASPPRPHKLLATVSSPELPPSILRSSQSHPASRPATPDSTATAPTASTSTLPHTANSIHFSSGAHPEHVVSADTSSSSSSAAQDNLKIHPASRPAFARRKSSDSCISSATPTPNTESGDVTRNASTTSLRSLPSGSGEASPARSAGAATVGILKPSGGTSNYGGRPGGPAMPNSRTTSSGGLSADIKPGYERRVGFDSMIDADETASGTFGFTLQVKSHGYQRTRNTRTFMCAVDNNAYSERALEWLMESLVEENDEIVTVTVLEGDPETIDQEQAREAAKDLMSAILTLNEEVQNRNVSIVVEFLAGRVTSTILRLIHMYRPDSLTIGTRGRTVSTLQKLIGGPMIGGSSRDILSSSPVPVVVVRPESKVNKHLRKRQADPKRRSYHALVDGSGHGTSSSHGAAGDSLGDYTSQHDSSTVPEEAVSTASTTGPPGEGSSSLEDRTRTDLEDELPLTRPKSSSSFSSSLKARPVGGAHHFPHRRSGSGDAH